MDSNTGCVFDIAAGSAGGACAVADMAVAVAVGTVERVGTVGAAFVDTESAGIVDSVVSFVFVRVAAVGRRSSVDSEGVAVLYCVSDEDIVAGV